MANVLLESGDDLLKEDGGFLLLESAIAPITGGVAAPTALYSGGIAAPVALYTGGVAAPNPLTSGGVAEPEPG